MTRGRKPKPAALRLVDGTHRPHRHGSVTAEQDRSDRARTAFGPMQKPPALKGEAAKAWKRYIEPASWLDGSREASAIAFCELWHEFRINPTLFHASKHSQLRAYMGELGLTDERNRPLYPMANEDEFFDD